MCDEFEDSDDLEENDDEFNALGSILSWDDDEDGANHVQDVINSVLRGEGRQTNGTSNNGNANSFSAPPDLVEFSTGKDGSTCTSFSQNATSFGRIQQNDGNSGGGSLSQKNSNELSNVSNDGILTLQLPLPTPIASFSASQQQQQSSQQQQSFQPVSLQQQHFANFAQLLAQQAGNFFSQQQNNASNQQQQVNAMSLRANMPNLQSIQQQGQSQQQDQSQQQGQNQQQGQQMQLSFTADASTFLQQMQFAQLQQQLQQAAQVHAQQQQAVQQQQPPAQFAPVSASASVPLTSSPVHLSVPATKKTKLLVPKKGAKAAATSSKMISKTNVASLNHVSASDTDGEASRTVQLKVPLPLESKKKKVDPIDMSNMSPSEKARANRDRNREHARNTRLRKKAYLEKLKTTVDELCRERDTLVTERASAANLLVEMHNTRSEVLMSFFALRTTNEKRRKLWSSILDESCFSCVTPVTPYRSFPASEVQVSKCQRTIMGIDAMMADTASLHVMFDTLVDRSKNPYGKISFRYTLVTEETVVAGNQMMARWIMTTTNAIELGAKLEVAKQGMLCCKFNSAHKIVSLELMFDVMAFMLQLKQAAGLEGFSVVPNTVQTCQRSFDKPMTLTLAEPPYTIVQVNKQWEVMTGYVADDVCGKASLSILHSPETDSLTLKEMMQEIRYKRPTSALLINATKSGETFTNFVLLFPLSTDSRILYYLGLTVFHEAGKPDVVDNPQEVSSNEQALAQNERMVASATSSVRNGTNVAVSGQAIEAARVAAMPTMVLGGLTRANAAAKCISFQQVGSCIATPGSNPSSILKDIQQSGSELGSLKRTRDS